MLSPFYKSAQTIEAGVDEAGRGCLAGPVFAAAVIMGPEIPQKLAMKLNDSKKLSASQRYDLRHQIEKLSLAYGVAMATPEEIDEINILNASFLAMHRAIEQLNTTPALLLIDGNRFKPFRKIDHVCIIKGDGLFLSIAAASILAKTYRDDYMIEKHRQFPIYGWDQNKGYPTIYHKQAIANNGLTPIHRKSFNSGLQLKLSL